MPGKDETILGAETAGSNLLKLSLPDLPNSLHLSITSTASYQKPHKRPRS